ncbi:zinc finger BED domain-containing protein RICESLEEPER 2-like [Setaria viridis]|uniref:zinc finger BED domain-containing protein RICESLEEPER 2-like n=1 Tax=Setaria viridis TaxID=4556 RepID=UPI001493BD52|nr:zinc finger BED domain-containing protein RICESLEEPER 2-like [Setaria viridis]XP_034571550.1 zinc finger BED domain-containing protein RICESLEEPER 2-like [Setaria viridis]XP_034571551.1 zinc finger BED domain-containing protein RICESLEEPER 2-like [Setaria viridis]XP_034571552.1 zinc finger BED domain-containing protein RICESLEEPER 2-like [Setaria viridis]XP_034571553.1 zinc finger BED domain-containing protein RICESLEEPER 2-like [Setaria viridis]
MVTQKTIRNDILDHYEIERRKVLDYLQKNSGRVAVTTELWTDDKRKRDYIAVTGHFIDKSWKPRRCILRFLYVPYPRASDALCDALYKCLESWDLNRKLSTLTLHNCSSDDALIPQTEAKIGTTNLLLGGRMLNMQCCAHSLDSVVKDGLEVIATAIEKIRVSVAYCLATPERYEKFEEAALSQQIELTEELCLDCRSKWNSTYTMLHIALGYNKVFDHLKQIDWNFTSCPTAEDWKSVSSVCDGLKVFHELREMFSGTKFVTANVFFIHICEIKMNMHKWLECGDPIIEKMSAVMVEKFDK